MAKPKPRKRETAREIPRIVIVSDGKSWHVRRLAVSHHDWTRDQMVYICDWPLSNDHASLSSAVKAARVILRSGAGKGRK